MAGTVSRGIQQLSSCTGIDTIKSKGMEIYSPTAEDLAKFRKVVQEPITEMIRKEVGKEWVDKLLKAVSNAEAELDK
jgi:TRAP-type C4-dicarboxylate transport system substrate-binding protein